MKTDEKQIQNAILDWLAWQPHCIAFPIQNGGIFDPSKKIFRSPPKHHIKGVADILGIWHMKPLAIEVKTERGRVSPEQKKFLEDYIAQGGVAFIARSLDDVINKLSTEELWKKKNPILIQGSS